MLQGKGGSTLERKVSAARLEKRLVFLLADIQQLARDGQFEIEMGDRPDKFKAILRDLKEKANIAWGAFLND